MPTVISPYDKNENPQAWTAWECLTRTGVSIFLTGRAGTGKTTFLKNLRDSRLKRMAIVAPTGVAAINAGGMTIHSFFQLAPAFYEPDKPIKIEKGMRREKLKMIRGVELLVIDEVSMVRPDLLDAVDARLRQVRRTDRPFGGVQLLLIGDLMQLPPVVKNDETDVIFRFYPSPFFFASRALAKIQYFAIELKRVYRQNDAKFIDLLNKVRNNCLTEADLELLNSRYNPSFNPPDSKRYIRLTTHNDTAASVNAARLNALKATPRAYEATVEGKFPENGCPAEKSLVLKQGAQVMFLKNDPQGRYYNGKIGHVQSLAEGEVTVSCDDADEPIVVKPYKWQNFSYSIDPKTAEVVQKEEGSFTQIPLILAWAITIHKSQGLTFDHAIIDAANSFSSGQVYVALSRCRTFEGLVLSSRLSNSSIRVDRDALSYMAGQEERSLSQEQIDSFAADYAMTVLADVLDFRPITVPAHQVLRTLQENYSTTYPRIINDIENSLLAVDQQIAHHAETFLNICRAKRAQGLDIIADQQLVARISAGAKYFEGEISRLFDHIVEVSDLTLGNVEINRRYADARSALVQELSLKRAILRWLAANSFSPLQLAQVKAEAVAQEQQAERKNTPSADSAELAEVRNKGLYLDLKKWRKEKADDENVPAFAILQNKTLMAIADSAPTTAKELAAVKVMGKTKIKKYGDEILNVVANHFSKSKR